MRVCFRHFAFVAVASLFLSAATNAQPTGQFTHINPPPPGEQSHAQILSHLYGGNFTPTGLDDHDFTNGTILAERVEDRIGASIVGGPLDIGDGSGDPTDQTWNANFTIANAKARYALFPQDFGYFDGPGGPGSVVPPVYHKLFDLQGSGYNVTGSKDLTSLAGRTLRWARGGEGRIWSSLEADNADLVDHLVTYQIHLAPSAQGPGGGAGGGDLTTWLIFWEDLFMNEPSDRDFNDLVVQIQAKAPVPEPLSGAALATAMLLGAARRRRARA